MNRVALMIGLAAIGIVVAVGWASRPTADALKTASPMSGLSLHGTAQIKDLPAARVDDHGFVFPASD
jgi:hypothetical protein